MGNDPGDVTAIRNAQATPMTDEQLIERLKAVANSAIAQLEDDPDQITELRAGRLRLTITVDGVYREHLVPQLTLFIQHQ